MFLIWNIIGIVLLIIEATTISFVSIFFSIGCFIASLVSLLTQSIGTQIIVMCIVSIIGTTFCRKFLQKHFEVNKEVKASNTDAMAGKSGLVIKTITKDNIGLVKVEGQIWSATSIDNDSLEEGTDIIVEYIDGVKLIVKKYN